MHKIQMYENLMEMLEREVKEIANKNNIDPQSLDFLYKIMLSIKSIDKHMETLEGGGMSSRDSSRRSYESSRRSYDSYEGNSNARRGRDGDGDGRYSERSYRNSRDSYEYSRDGATQAMKMKLEEMLEEPISESNRLALMACLDKIK